MSRFTRCKDVGKMPRALRGRTILRTMMTLGFVLVFALGHMHLRFSLDQLEHETIQLQQTESALLSEINALKGTNETLKHPRELFDYARHELGMAPYDQTRREVVQIPADLHARYAVARATYQRQPANRSELALERELVWLDTLGERMGLLSQAQASDWSQR